jgi:hypothetical protein
VVKRPIVLPSEIMNLAKLTGFLKLPGGYPRPPGHLDARVDAAHSVYQ